MATVGPVAPASATTDGGSGDPWTNVNNVLTDNGSNASVSLANGVTCEWLRVLFGTNLSAIPDGATINGIEFEVQASPSTGTLSNMDFQLTKDGTTRVGSDLAPFNPDANHTLGGATELWGTTWTAAEIKASGFGCHTRCTGGPGGGSYAIDVILCTVYYTEVGGAAPAMRQYRIRRAVY